MMNRLFHPDHGYTTCNSEEEATLMKAGWRIVTDKDWQEILAQKTKAVAKPAVSVTIEEQQMPRRAGRPRKELSGVTHEYSTNTD
jgi:hypothetical protein